MNKRTNEWMNSSESLTFRFASLPNVQQSEDSGRTFGHHCCISVSKTRVPQLKNETKLLQTFTGLMSYIDNIAVMLAYECIRACRLSAVHSCDTAAAAGCAAAVIVITWHLLYCALLTFVFHVLCLISFLENNVPFNWHLATLLSTKCILQRN